MNTPHRRHLRRLETIYGHIGREPLYYLTCCVEDRQTLLAQRQAADLLEAAWRQAGDLRGWRVGRYVIMPDHVHFFASPKGDDASSLSEFMRSWKSWTSRCIRAAGFASFSWQPEFFDHLLRNAESYSQKWDYVWRNPVRKGLVSTPEEWPYQGEISDLSW